MFYLVICFAGTPTKIDFSFKQLFITQAEAPIEILLAIITGPIKVALAPKLQLSPISNSPFLAFLFAPITFLPVRVRFFPIFFSLTRNNDSNRRM